MDRLYTLSAEYTNDPLDHVPYGGEPPFKMSRGYETGIVANPEQPYDLVDELSSPTCTVEVPAPRQRDVMLWPDCCAGMDTDTDDIPVKHVQLNGVDEVTPTALLEVFDLSPAPQPSAPASDDLDDDLKTLLRVVLGSLKGLEDASL